MEELAKLILILWSWALPGPQSGYVMEEINPFWDIQNSINTNKYEQAGSIMYNISGKNPDGLFLIFGTIYFTICLVIIFWGQNT